MAQPNTGRVIEIGPKGHGTIEDNVTGDRYTFKPSSVREVNWRRKAKGHSHTKFGDRVRAPILKPGNQVHFALGRNNEVSAVGLSPPAETDPRRKRFCGNTKREHTVSSKSFLRRAV